MALIFPPLFHFVLLLEVTEVQCDEMYQVRITIDDSFQMRHRTKRKTEC